MSGSPKQKKEVAVDASECNARMLAELKVLVERLGSSKTDEEAEEIQTLATELMGACRIKDGDIKNRTCNDIKPKLDRLKNPAASCRESSTVRNAAVPIYRDRECSA
jgi:hypothetical protein